MNVILLLPGNKRTIQSWFIYCKTGLKLCMDKKYVCILLYCFYAAGVFAQHDTIGFQREIEQVTVTYEREAFTPGSRIENIQPMQKLQHDHLSLGEALQLNSSIYLKSNASGMSTLRMRGTTADHTALIYGPINLNSLTLGHSNFSNIPMFLFESISVHKGSNSSIYGTDALAGAVRLDTDPAWTNGVAHTFRQDVGSFHDYFTGAKLFVGNGRWENKLKFYRRQDKNDFSFKNTQGGYDFETKKFSTDMQINAELLNYGILDELSYRINDISFIRLVGWYENNWHEIQPNMATTNKYQDSTSSVQRDHLSEIFNEHIRSFAEFQKKDADHSIRASLGYVHDNQLYDKNDRILTNRGVSRVRFIKKIPGIHGVLKLGGKYNYLVPDVYAYAKENIREEHRSDFFAGYIQHVFKSSTIAVNIRRPFVSNYNSIWCPSAGLNMLLWSNASQSINAKVSWGKGYKIPTLNDRFWNKLGNPELLPEESNNYEIGGRYALYSDRVKIKFELTGYHMYINNLIAWTPIGGEWRPVNKDTVINNGAELSLLSTLRLSKLQIQLNQTYSYTHSKVFENGAERDQQVYTPRRLWRTNLNIKYKSWRLSPRVSYTGERIYAYGEEPLESYTLVGIDAGKKITWDVRHQLTLQASVYNLFDIAYQNWNNYAMPGRSYRLNLIYTFN